MPVESLILGGFLLGVLCGWGAGFFLARWLHGRSLRRWLSRDAVRAVVDEEPVLLIRAGEAADLGA